MKHIKFKNKHKLLRLTRKEMIKGLNLADRKQFYKNNLIGYGIMLLTVLSFIIIICLCVFIFNNFLTILSISLGLIICPIFLGVGFSKTQLSNVYTYQTFKSLACKPFRDFYCLTEPFVCTKCYDSTIPGFKDKDVCVFMYNGNLRITTNIVYGFLNYECDLGCLEFNLSQVQVEKTKFNEFDSITIIDENDKIVLAQQSNKIIKNKGKRNK